MQPKACIPPPEGDRDPVKQLLDAGGGVLGVDSLGNGLPERPNGGDGVLSQSSQSLGHNWDEVHPCRTVG